MNAFRPVLAGSGMLLISGLIGTAGLAQAATATLVGGTGSCTIASLAGDGAGNLTITCAGGGGSSTPTCNGGSFSGVVGAVTSMTLSCTSASTATWSWVSGPSNVPLSGINASATFPVVGTYVYSVTPVGATQGSPVQVSVNVTSGTAPPPPPPGTGDVALCTAYPGGYRELFSYTLGSSITNFYTLNANSSGYAPMASVRLQMGASTGPSAKGSIMINESPFQALQGVNKWASISTRPCDFTDASGGGTAKWVIKGTSVSISYTAEDLAVEGYITPYAFMPSYREGVRLRAGQTYYLNIVNGGATWNTPACPAGSNCGVVIDISRP